MHLKSYIIWAILTSTSLSASAGFEGFPLATSTNDISRNWLTAQEAWEPVRQLFGAVQERALAAGSSFNYVEEVLVDAEWVYQDPTGTETNMVSVFSLFPYEWESEEDPVGEQEGWDLYRWLDEEQTQREWWISDYFEGWKTPLSDDGEEWFVDLVFEIVQYAVPLQSFRDVVSITVTNQMGPFDLAMHGTNYTGVTYVTRDLLDAMWEKIEEIAPEYVFPGDVSPAGWGSWDSWFGKTESKLPVVPSSSLWQLSDVGNAPHKDRVARRAPYVPYLSTAYALHNAGHTNAVISAISNDWGIVIGGEVQTQPLTDSLFAGTVNVQSTAYMPVSMEEVVEDGETNMVPVFGWVTTGAMASNSEGIDLKYYLDNTNAARAVLMYTGTNELAPAITAEISGRRASVTLHTSLETNLVWNLEALMDKEFEVILTTNTVESMSYIVQTETLSIGESSEYVWSSGISDGVQIIAYSPTNHYDSFALVWEVEHWEPQAYRLYAEELDRMYHVLREMRWTMPVYGREGVLEKFPNQAVIDPVRSVFRKSYGSREPWTEGLTERVRAAYGSPYGALGSAPTYRRSGEVFSWGEYDGGHGHFVSYEDNPNYDPQASFDDLGYDNNTDPANPTVYLGHGGFRTSIPWWWVPYDFTTNIWYGGFDSAQGTRRPWAVVTSVENENRPPDRGAVELWVDEQNEADFMQGSAFGGRGGGGFGVAGSALAQSGKSATGGGGAGPKGVGGSGAVYIFYEPRDAGVPLAQGGIISTLTEPGFSGQILHAFTSAGEYTFTTIPEPDEDGFMVNVIVVGGGGAGGDPAEIAGGLSGGRGGGGGGEVVTSTNNAVSLSWENSYTITVGAGGTPNSGTTTAEDGAPSEVVWFVAQGGETPILQGDKGGDSGSSELGGSGESGAGGGGGGAGEAGSDARSMSWGGDGGNGIDLSTILGVDHGDRGWFGGGGAGGDISDTIVNTNKLPFALHARGLMESSLIHTQDGPLLGDIVDEIITLPQVQYPDIRPRRAVNIAANARVALAQHWVPIVDPAFGVLTGYLNRHIATFSDGYFAFIGAANLVFDYAVPSELDIGHEARVYLGDYSSGVLMDKLLDPIQPVGTVAAFELQLGLYTEDESVETRANIFAFPPRFFTLSLPNPPITPLIWHGNDVLDGRQAMQSFAPEYSEGAYRVSMYATGDTEAGALSGAEFWQAGEADDRARVPAAPELPSDETANSILRWQGYDISEMFFIIDWDFQYK